MEQGSVYEILGSHLIYVGAVRTSKGGNKHRLFAIQIPEGSTLQADHKHVECASASGRRTYRLITRAFSFPLRDYVKREGHQHSLSHSDVITILMAAEKNHGVLLTDDSPEKIVWTPDALRNTEVQDNIQGQQNYSQDYIQGQQQNTQNNIQGHRQYSQDDIQGQRHAQENVFQGRRQTQEFFQATSSPVFTPTPGRNNNDLKSEILKEVGKDLNEVLKEMATQFEDRFARQERDFQNRLERQEKTFINHMKSLEAAVLGKKQETKPTVINYTFDDPVNNSTSSSSIQKPRTVAAPKLGGVGEFTVWEVQYRKWLQNEKTKGIWSDDDFLLKLTNETVTCLKIKNDLMHWAPKDVSEALDKMKCSYAREHEGEEDRALQAWEDMKREADDGAGAYICRFDTAFAKIQSYGHDLSDTLRARKLLMSSNLTLEQLSIVRAISEKSYDAVKEKILKIVPDLEEVANYAGGEEGVHYGRSGGKHRGKNSGKGADKGKKGSFSKGRSRGFNSGSGKGKGHDHRGTKNDRFRDMRGKYRKFQTTRKKFQGSKGFGKKNAVDSSGKVRKCFDCGSEYHFAGSKHCRGYARFAESGGEDPCACLSEAHDAYLFYELDENEENEFWESWPENEEWIDESDCEEGDEDKDAPDF